MITKVGSFITHHEGHKLALSRLVENAQSLLQVILFIRPCSVVPDPLATNVLQPTVEMTSNNICSSSRGPRCTTLYSTKVTTLISLARRSCAKL